MLSDLRNSLLFALVLYARRVHDKVNWYLQETTLQMEMRLMEQMPLQRPPTQRTGMI